MLDINDRVRLEDPPLRARIVTANNNQCIKLLSNVEAKQVLDCKENYWKLFPHNSLYLAREILELKTDNWDIILNDLCVDTPIFGTIDSNEPGHIVESISFGHQLQVAIGLLYRIEYYGNDVNDAVHHAYCHLVSLWDHFKRGVMCVKIYMPAYLDEIQLRHQLTSLVGLSLKLKSPSAFAIEEQFVDGTVSFMRLSKL